MSYSQQVAQAITNHLDNIGFHYSFDAEKGRVKFGMQSKSKLRNIQFDFDIRDNGFVVYAYPPLKGEPSDPEMMKQLNRLVSYINYPMLYGRLNLDNSDGEIQFQQFIPVDGIVAPEEFAENAIGYPMSIFRRYADAIVGVILLGSDAKEVYETCRNA